MNEKTIKTRLINKHDTESNWLKAENFVPLKGEFIIYDNDENNTYTRIKIGDGISKVNELPFYRGVGIYTNEGGEIFNDYDNNTASAKYASAKGTMVTASGIGSSSEGLGLVASTQKFLGISIATLSVKIASVSGNTLKTESTIGLDTILSNINNSNGFIIKIGGQFIPIKSYTSSGIVSKTVTMVSFNDTVDSSLAGQIVEDLFLGVAAGDYSHHEGSKNLVLSKFGHGEGELNTISGLSAHGEGGVNFISGDYAHGEGLRNKVSGQAGHVQGMDNEVQGLAAFASGVENKAIGNGSVSLGKGNTAVGHYTMVRGKYAPIDETEDFGTFVDMVGNGSDENNRSVAYALDWEGNGYFAGDVEVNGSIYSEGKKLATVEKVNEIRQMSIDNDEAIKAQINTLDIKIANTRTTIEEAKTHNQNYSDNLFANASANITTVDTKVMNTRTMLEESKVQLQGYIDTLVNDTVSKINAVDTKIGNTRNVAGNAIKNTVTAQNQLTIVDAVPIPHKLNIKLLGVREKENLIPEVSFDKIGYTTTINGVNFTWDVDGYLTIEGTATDNAAFIIKSDFETKANRIYTISGFERQDADIISGGEVWLYLRNKEDTDNYLHITNMEQNKIVYFAKEDASTRIQVTVRKGVTINTSFRPIISYAPDITYNNVIYSISDIDGTIAPNCISNGDSHIYMTSQNGAYITATYNQDTEKVIDKKVAALVDSAPQTLNTLNELAAALGDDPNFATTMVTELDKKVDVTHMYDEINLLKNNVNAEISNKADKASSLSGYGITDAYTKTQADEKFDNMTVGKKTTYYSEIFNDYTNNKTNISYAHIEGKNNKAVIKSYEITEINDITRVENTDTYITKIIIRGGSNYSISEIDGLTYYQDGCQFNVGDIWNCFVKNQDGAIIKYRGNIKAYEILFPSNSSYYDDVYTYIELEGNPLTYEYKNEDGSVDNLPLSTSGDNTFLNNLIINGGTVGDRTILIEDIAEANISIHMDGASNVGYFNTHVEGEGNKAIGYASDAGGYYTVASGERAFTRGYKTKATGHESEAGGNQCSASGYASSAKGNGTKAIGRCSVSRGNATEAIGDYSIASGNATKAKGRFSWAGGSACETVGEASDAKGRRCIANASYSSAKGEYTDAQGRAQSVRGMYNKKDIYNYRKINNANYGQYADIVGNGTSESNRSNAYTLDWDGNAWFAGEIECSRILLTSPNGTKFAISVNDDGVLTSTKI